MGNDPAGSAGLASPAVGQRATVPYRVRFDEATPDGDVRPSTILRWAQDAAWIHSEALGYDRAWYLARGLTWLVRAIELAVREPLRFGERVAVSTEVTGFRKVWARRRTEVARDGQLLAWVHTDWVMVDGRGLPTRIPDEFPRRFEIVPGPFSPGRVHLPEAPPAAIVRQFAVRQVELDPLGHVNNAAYLDYLEEVLADLPGGIVRPATVPRIYRLEYLAAAGPGDRLRATAWPIVGGMACRLSTAAGEEVLRGIVAG